MDINRNDSLAFNRFNMKPVAGETVDSLWVQNIADNTAHNFYQKGATVNWGPIFGLYEDAREMTSIHDKRGNLELTANTTLVGTYRPFAEGFADVAGSFHGTLYIGTVAVSTFSRGTGFDQNSGENDVDFEYDISALGTIGMIDIYFGFTNEFDVSGWAYEPDSYSPGHFTYGLSFLTLKTEE